MCGRLCEGELGGGGRVEVCVCVCACERGISWSSCACNKTTQYSQYSYLIPIPLIRNRRSVLLDAHDLPHLLQAGWVTAGDIGVREFCIFNHACVCVCVCWKGEEGQDLEFPYRPPVWYHHRVVHMYVLCIMYVSMHVGVYVYCCNHASHSPLGHPLSSLPQAYRESRIV